MKFFRFIFSSAITLSLILLLNSKYGEIPPIGKLLDPFQGFWANAETEILTFNQEAFEAGLTEKITIQYEDNLIPHIFAENEHDLYYAQGFITAYHRLWQMEFLMHVASGRVSEILGRRALDFDRRQRRKGLVYGAENSLRELEKDISQIAFIEAYTEGVNAYINQLKPRDYPIEYKLLDYHPEKWTTLKNVLVLKYMADDLSGSDRDLQNTNAYQLLGKERFDFLFPDIPDGIDPIIPKNTKWDFEPLSVTPPDTLKVQNNYITAEPSETEPGIGSNNWAISGDKSATGNPIFSNDPHLRFSIPSIWFALQLNAPGINTYGASIPGLPGVLLGFNDSLAWGLTNAPRDIRDWYQVTFKDAERNEYIYDGKWLKTQKRIEQINIKGTDPFYDTIIYTHYGPVFYDKTFTGNDNKVNFALKWTAHNPSKELLTIYKLNRARNLTDIEEAIAHFECPPQNLAVATRQGDIALFIEGLFPLKWKDQGKFLLDGSDPDYEWQGFIPKSHNARIINPVRGFISSANQHPFDSTYPYYYYNDMEEFYRNRRINNFLSSSNNISVQDLKDLQADSYHLLAAETLPVMIDSLDKSSLSDESKKIVDLLLSWNYYTNPDQVAPSYFEVWWHFIRKMVWDEFEDNKIFVTPNKYITSQLILQHPLDSAFDIKKTEKIETMEEILLLSFKASLDSLNTWKAKNDQIEPVWYKFKNTRLMHLTNINSFSIFEVKTGGNKSIVNANGPTWGASWRLVVDLGDEINAWGIYPGGQNGNPGSKYYNNFVDDWANNEYFKINFWPKPVNDNQVLKTIQTHIQQ